MAFITPKFVREAIADRTGRKAHGIKVRIVASAIFYGAVGFVLGGGTVAAGLLLS